MAEVYLSLGSNVGERRENLRRAVEALAPQVAVDAVSSVYESVPHAGFDFLGRSCYDRSQPYFYNIALKGTTALLPRELLRHLKSVEKALGRADAPRNAPRPIDLDILLYDQAVVRWPDLSVPHPHMHRRAFVLAPLDEIAPFVRHPVIGRVVADLNAELGDYGARVWVLDGRSL